LIIRRIQPQHALEGSIGFIETLQAPQAQSVSVHAAEKRAVVRKPPWQKAVESLAEG